MTSNANLPPFRDSVSIIIAVDVAFEDLDFLRGLVGLSFLEAQMRCCLDCLTVSSSDDV